MLPLLLLSACFGLDAVPKQEKDGDGHNLDSGLPLDSGDPLDSAQDDNAVPVADAGADIEVTLGFVVSLDGSGSSDPDGDPLTYDWRFITKPGSSAANLVDEDRPDPQFVPDVVGVYELGLVVDDGALESLEDSVVVTVTAENGDPVANAGSDQRVAVGDPVVLDGSRSADPDGDPLQYAWTLVTRPSGSAAALTSSTSASPRFVADVAGTYEVSLTVTDGFATSAPDSVRITAEEGGDTDTDTACGCRSTSVDGALGALVLLALTTVGGRRRR
jgi:MYXO-CTERM domain-containing protein